MWVAAGRLARVTRPRQRQFFEMHDDVVEIKICRTAILNYLRYEPEGNAGPVGGPAR